jgi:8-oxo-dGTP pyrophosphatase MutT (NUDIX family)
VTAVSVPTWRFDATLRRWLDARFASFVRRALTLDPTPPDPRPRPLKAAAVAVALVDVDGEAGLLLTRRAPTLRAHAGQWALPGGRCDDGEDAVAAALRELDEELGLRIASTEALGLLDDYPTRSGYRITPVVLWVTDTRSLMPNPTEVASVHRVALRPILDPAAVDFVTIAQSTRRVVRIRIADRLIHAPTAAVLYQFRELVAGRDTRVAELEQPPFAWR